MSDKPDVKKIIELVVGRIGYQNPIESRKAKEILQDIYTTLDIKKKATASKLNDYFICKEINNLLNGKCTKFVELIKEKTDLEDC